MANNVTYVQEGATPPNRTVVRTVEIDGQHYQVLIPAKEDGTLIDLSLIEALQELAARLAPLASVIANTQQLRSVVTGAVTATGGGYITSAQEVAALLTQTNSLRLPLDNTLAIQSNINNCTGA